MVQIGFVAGWLLFVAAFLLAILDIHTGTASWITTSEDMLRTYIPAKWIIFKADLPKVLVDMVLIPVLQIPAWLLAGAPGFLLIWNCRPHRGELDEGLVESLDTWERLAELAEEEKASDEMPGWTDVDDIHVTQMDSVEDYMRDWVPGQASDEPGTPDK